VWVRSRGGAELPAKNRQVRWGNDKPLVAVDVKRRFCFSYLTFPTNTIGQRQERELHGHEPDYYGEADEAESIATVHRAIDLGVNFFDTAEVYGLFGATAFCFWPRLNSRKRFPSCNFTWPSVAGGDDEIHLNEFGKPGL
jgi:hypothetical protein